MKSTTGVSFVFMLTIAILFGVVTPVHAQFNSENPLIQAIPQFRFSDDRLLNDIAPDTDFGFTIQSITEDFREAITFDAVKKAELKIEHAKNQQERINQLDTTGNQIPLEFEERRIVKLNEARDLIESTRSENSIGKDADLVIQRNQERNAVYDSFESLREMGELNDIRILYSQLPRVIDADDKTKQEYNQKVNSLDTWKNNCRGEFDVNDMKPLNKAVEKLEIQCPKLVDLQKKFGYERIKLIVSGTI